MIFEDIKKVFMNQNDLAIQCSVDYDGTVYEDISAVYIGLSQLPRKQLTNDYGEGLFLLTTELYCDVKDIGGTLPEKGKRIAVQTQDGLYKEFVINASDQEYGMCHLVLEVIGE